MIRKDAVSLGNMVPEKVKLTMFSADEIRRLSVVEVSAQVTTDILGNRVPKSLYDAKMGPIAYGEECATCCLSSVSCPGHFGHISLPLPVYNPALFSVVLQLLKSTCFSCYRLVVDDKAAVYFCALLDMLYAIKDEKTLTPLFDLEEFLTTSDAKTQGVSDILYKDLQAKSKEILKEYKIKPSPSTSGILTRGLLQKRSEIFKNFLGYLKTSAKCPHCFVPMKALRSEKSVKIFATSAVSKRAALSGNVEDQQTFVTPSLAKELLTNVYKGHPVDREVLKKLVVPITKFNPSPNFSPVDILFIEALPVPPSRYRPLRRLGEQTFEADINSVYSDILQGCENISVVVQTMLKEEEVPASKPEVPGSKRKLKNVEVASTAQKANERIVKTERGLKDIQGLWTNLQISINNLWDSELVPRSVYTKAGTKNGLKQVLAGKTGLIRKNLMGKRVNCSARSVIAPDFNVDMDEAGIPELFARKLTFPVAVNEHNFDELRQLVLNGPDIYPGAIYIENEYGIRQVLPKDKTRREAIANSLLSRARANPTQSMVSCAKLVHRHMQEGDMILLNRQPTLHRPSLQAHRARILPNEKTLRLHYANCKAYNADFDGDEMNVHFPQSLNAKAEAKVLAAVSNQMLVPKDGSPLAGLIQDHIAAGALISLREVFLDRGTFMQLLSITFSKIFPKKFVIPPPTIMKPRKLWTGKQLITALFTALLPSDCKPVSFESKSKVKENVFRDCVTTEDPYLREETVVFRQCKFLNGVLDKSQIGATEGGLLYYINVLCGGNVTVQMVSCLGRLLTGFLSRHGLSHAVVDVTQAKSFDDARKEDVKSIDTLGREALLRKLQTNSGIHNGGTPDQQTDAWIASSWRKIHLASFERVQIKDVQKEIDTAVKSVINRVQDRIVKRSLPDGGSLGFPHNNLTAMIETGAKGGKVNSIQMSCVMGQIDCNGRRPRQMVSGKSLPGFLPYATQPRAAGFVSDRFLTGLRPQEFFFHCVAGRSGLVDTAVKTSRSGYLQRCLVKHLEAIKIEYDGTVRDAADGSVVQFLYGEDGLDVVRAQYLKKSELLDLAVQNASPDEWHQIETVATSLSERSPDILERVVAINTKLAPQIRDMMGHPDYRYVKHPPKSFIAFSRDLMWEADEKEAAMKEQSRDSRGWQFAFLKSRWAALSNSKKAKYEQRAKRSPDPVTSIYFPTQSLGITSECFSRMVNEYCDRLETVSDAGLNELWRDMSLTNAPKPRPGKKVKLPPLDRTSLIDNAYQLLQARYMRSLSEPGEAVGMICAQSLGEPSTQMTLNTFHFAGQSEMNVTLGIPRLRELLMTASKEIKTPLMEVPLLPGASLNAARKLKKKMRKIYLSYVISNVEIEEFTPTSCANADEENIDSDGEDSSSGPRSRRQLEREANAGNLLVSIKFNLLPRRKYRDEFIIKPSEVLAAMEGRFFANLANSVHNRMTALAEVNGVSVRTLRILKPVIDASCVAEGDSDLSAKEQRRRQRKEDDKDDRREVDVPAFQSTDKEDESFKGAPVGKKKKIKLSEDDDGDEDKTLDDDEGIVYRTADDDKPLTDEDEDEEEGDDDEDAQTNKGDSQKDNDNSNDASIISSTPVAAAKTPSKRNQPALSRRDAVRSCAPNLLLDYSYDDSRKSSWAQITLQVPLARIGFDWEEIIRDECNKFIVHSCRGVTRAFLDEDKRMFTTQGVNLGEAIRHSNLLDSNRAFTNDVDLISRTFGIEAARNAIVRETRSVFAAYGIGVDFRHLSLLADYMCISGTVQPLSRFGMRENPSFLSKMTFETPMPFMKEALLRGDVDSLRAPSTTIMFGKFGTFGTGNHDILIDLSSTSNGKQ